MVVSLLLVQLLYDAGGLDLHRSSGWFQDRLVLTNPPADQA
jgi:hypothetical protein